MGKMAQNNALLFPVFVFMKKIKKQWLESKEGVEKLLQSCFDYRLHHSPPGRLPNTVELVARKQTITLAPSPVTIRDQTYRIEIRKNCIGGIQCKMV